MLHGLVAAAGAIDNSPPTFVVTPRRCGSSVGGYPTFAELGLTVCGGSSTRGMGERVGRAPRSRRLWKAMILDFSLLLLMPIILIESAGERPLPVAGERPFSVRRTILSTYQNNVCIDRRVSI